MIAIIMLYIIGLLGFFTLLMVPSAYKEQGIASAILHIIVAMTILSVPVFVLIL